jgi:hypothetical protein
LLAAADVPQRLGSDWLRAAVRSTTGGGVATSEKRGKFNADANRVLVLSWLLALVDFLV